MKITRTKTSIVIHDPTDFNVDQMVECGQIFRYSIDGAVTCVYSKGKCAILTTFPDRIEIKSNDLDYFYNFFDLDRDYAKIKTELKKDPFLAPAIDFGYGIRIVNNDPFEMIISFMISANNNIPRIKHSIEYLCSHFGRDMGSYFAFPTLGELKTAKVEDFLSAGLGYRAAQMYDTVQRLTEKDIKNLLTMSHDERFNFLISLKGVGEKVANCILLFGLGEKNAFPVDTWINKVYNDLTHTRETNRKKIARELTARYGTLSGFAQQYVFYYYRNKKS